LLLWNLKIPGWNISQSDCLVQLLFTSGLWEIFLLSITQLFIETMLVFLSKVLFKCIIHSFHVCYTKKFTLHLHQDFYNGEPVWLPNSWIWTIFTCFTWHFWSHIPSSLTMFNIVLLGVSFTCFTTLSSCLSQSYF
jgi:hypothetical protein